MPSLAIYLFVCVAGSAPGTPNFLCKQHRMPDMDVCQRAVQNTVRASLNNATSDKESRVFFYCAPEGKWSNP